MPACAKRAPTAFRPGMSSMAGPQKRDPKAKTVTCPFVNSAPAAYARTSVPRARSPPPPRRRCRHPFGEARARGLLRLSQLILLRSALAPLASGIRAAFVYGSLAKREDTATSDVDLMVVSDTRAYPDLYAALEDTGRRLGRPVSPTIYTRNELARRVERHNAFLTKVLANPKILLIGGDDDLAT
ncbi:MAG: nucleotidyltransferase domain-containing protein [Gemmatimonadaceae bacterium]